MKHLVSQEQLLEWTGYTRPGDVENFLRKHHVTWFPGKRGQICTTMDAINKALELEGKINGTQAKR